MRMSISQVWKVVIATGLVAFLAIDAGAVAVSLKGSPDSMVRQNLVAKQHDLTFATTDEDVMGLIEQGDLVPVEGNANYFLLPNMMYPFAQPEMHLFIIRLAEQYHEGTGERLVITSLTRPADKQPKNGHSLSVHPTGMAVDLRVSKKARSRAWLESVLLRLERQGILDVTRERYPPHYHVALFPSKYREHVENLIGAEEVARVLEEIKTPREVESIATASDSSAGATRLAQTTATVLSASSSNVRKGGPLAVLAVLSLSVVPFVYYRRRRATPED